MKTILTAPLLTDSPFAEEIELEHEAIDAGIDRYRALAAEAVDRNDGASLKPAERWLVRWIGPVASAIKEDQGRYRRNKPDVGINVWGPPLGMIDADVAALAALREALSACMREPDGAKTVIIANAIGRAILAEAWRVMLKDETETQRRDRPDGTSIETTSSKWQLLCAKFRTLTVGKVNWWAKSRLDQPVFEHKAQTHIGARLLYHVQTLCNCSVEDAKKNDDGTVSVPFRLAFHRRRTNKGVSIIVADDTVFRIIQKGHDVRQLMRPRYQPMIVEPLPWVQKQDETSGETFIEGGYARIRTPFVAKPTRAQKAALAAADKTVVFDYLSDLSATSTRVNRRVLEVARAFAGADGVPGIPTDRDVPSPPQHDNWDSLTDEQKKDWKRRHVEARRANRRLAADRVEHLARVGIAERFVNRPRIWFPHQLDFRSRAYPIPAHLNFHGEDLCRGLIEFADAKEPGEAGIEALKVHAASCWGLDKASIATRLEWAEQHAEHIERVAREPLDFHWWMQADGGDQAWQFLAACLAIADPMGAGAHLPVKRDGTCNGLQHYAAMGLDPVGAAAVNLTLSTRVDTPADVYAAIAGIAARSISESTSPLAAMLDGKVDRWVVKPNVMTKTYGVTMVGARQQLSPRLKKRGVPQASLYECSNLLSRVVLASIGDACPAAASIMDWLKSTAQIIVRAKRGIEWTTPIGFPVVQPYRRWKNVQVATIMQTLKLGLDEEGLPPHATRQINGLAPNFIHSIDATHMLTTAHHAVREGLAFLAVHDAFWTHAEDADRLCEITRNTFVDLHTPDLAADLHRQFTDKYRIELPPPPPRGTFDLEQTRNALYLFN